MVGPRVTEAPRLDPPRVVLLGDGAWATRTLLRLAAEGWDVAAVVARRAPSDAGLLDTARAHGIRVHRPARINAPESVALLASHAPHVMLSVAYDQILGPGALAVPALGTVNVHAGALPRYRGRNVVNWAILNGEREIGVTAHLVDEGIDSGDVLVQRLLPIGWTDGYGDVLARVVDAVPEVALEALTQLATGRATRTPQDPALAFYTGGREEGDEWLDWAWPSVRLHNTVRAITRPGPGARTSLGPTPVTIWRAHYEPAWPCYLGTPGQVVGRRDDGVLVKTGDSTLLVHEAQVGDAAPAVPRWRIGTRLGANLAAAVEALAARVAALEAALDASSLRALR